MAKRTMQRSAPRAQQHRSAAVVNLGVVRQRRKRELAEGRVRAVIDDNRAALGRLFNSGLIFTQQGSRAGRDLLGAHQTLLRIADLFAQLREERRHDAALEMRAEEAFAHLDEQLEKSAELAARTGEFVGGRGRE